MTRVHDGPVRVGLLGFGTVGSALADLLAARSDLELGPVAVRDLDKPRRLADPRRHLTTDPQAVIDGADVVVEVMGGVDVATDAMLAALAAGRPVVTANKAALAERWEAFRPALEAGTLHLEAAVMAGTPAVGPVAGALRGSAPSELHAILNGTATFVLRRLEAGVAYDAAVREAQALGYAEADPTLDVGGIDAAHKLAILARLTVDPDLAWPRVRAATRGIDALTPAVVQEAMEDGGQVQLVGSLVHEAGAWAARVRPVYLPAGHPLAGRAGAALLYRGAGGEVLLTGPGAGGPETASAVLSDVLAAAAGRPGPAPLDAPAPAPTTPRLEDLGEIDPA
ncbi:MAG: homoserine dehydrogenase [Trueperaceae bacterium]|nr:homoserine dehydrogenase [Trueperaceae bacterium]